MTTDLELLRDYTRNKSEDSFAALVNRHLNLVYSAALRQVRSPQLAEEVAQSAFTDLVRQAPRLSPDTILTAWLYQVTRRTAIDVVRRESRRQFREQIALEMNTLNATAADWPQIEPLLDEAMQALEEPDRTAVLLRYFENKSLREVGQTLGTSEDAAQKRVSRAVERLREFFIQHGVAAGTSGVGALISANAVQAAPVGMAAMISTGAALAALSIPASAGAGAIAGIFGTLFEMARTKLAAGLAATALVGVVAFVSFRSQRATDEGAVANTLQTTSTNPDQTRPATASSPQDASAGAEQRAPDPLKLLMTVAQARQRIQSGSMALQLSTENFGSGRRETNQHRMTALFDGPKLRFEQFVREYSYTYSEDEAKQEEIRKRADSMDRESAAQAGLLKPFESHHTVVHDGTVLLDYWENDGKPNGTTINDPHQGTSSFLFDPRCLGLRTSLSFGSTIENCLAYADAKSINLMGKELVEGTSAWHVRLESKYGEALEFWVDVARPDRLLKHARGLDVAVSRYNDADARDPIPTEVTTMEFRNGSPSFGKRLIRSNSHFNQTIDPSSFTLAGLGMAINTPVTDIRIRRSIGYWNGTGLSDNLALPGIKGPKPQSHTNRVNLLALLELSPGSPEALEAASWILLNTPDGPEVQKAAEVILGEHTRDASLLFLCNELERLRHRCSKPLLEAILKDNPSDSLRGNACFCLAALLKDEAKYGQDKKATAEAEKLFERVITEFGKVKHQRGFKLEDLARPELSELRHLTIGKPAPEIEGEDLNGQRLKLSDYRGKVVVLTFWWPGNSRWAEHRKLLERMSGKAFACLGVYGDDDLNVAKAEVEKYGITWPSFRDKRGGPISTSWNVRGWPDTWVIDRQGVIRYRDIRWRELDEAVDALVRE